MWRGAAGRNGLTASAGGEQSRRDMPLLALPFPHIDPIAIELGPFAIRWYALAYVAGILLGWWYSRRLAAAERLWGATRRPTLADMDDLIVWIALGIVLGGRVGYVLFYNLPAYASRPWEILEVWRGGMSFHGGFLGVILAIFLFARRRGLNFLAILDVAAVVTPIGLFTGRLANFVNGELWGRAAPPDLPWGVVFPLGGPIARHPSQLYEAATEGLLLLLVMGLAARRFGFRRPGLLGGLFVLGYAVARIGCEFFREPDAQLGFLLGGVTMGQILSLPMAAVGLTLLVAAARGWTRPRTGDRPAPA